MYKAQKKYYNIYDTFALLDTTDRVQWDGAKEGVAPVPEETATCEGMEDNKKKEAALLEEGEVMVHA